jgi:hypothetical protein
MLMMYLFVVYRVGVRGISEMYASLENRIYDCFGMIVAQAPYLIHEPML